MKLLKLELRNFKGQKSLTLAPNGNDLSIYADNGVGKTTVADAFFWLLFGKDSRNRTDFEIKTLNSEGTWEEIIESYVDEDGETQESRTEVFIHGPNYGEPIPFLEHEVSAVLETAPGETIELKKTLVEDWTTKRRGTKKEFTGHTMHHKVNGVPVQKQEYDRWIAGICDEKRFRLLTDPNYFNSDSLKTTEPAWKVRRQILLDDCGDVSDADVIASAHALKDLPAILGNHSLDNYRKIIVARKKEINSEIEKIPVRIDELTRSIITSTSPAGNPEPLRARLRKLTEDRARLEAGGQIAEKTKALRELEADSQSIFNRLRSQAFESTSEARSKLTAAENELSRAESDCTGIRYQVKADQSAVAEMDELLTEARKLFAVENAKTFKFTGEDVCPACNQALPAADVEAARTAAESAFNETKANTLETIRKNGVALSEKARAIEDKVTTKTKAIEEAQVRIAELTEIRNQVKVALDAQFGTEPNVHEDPAYQKAIKAQDAIKAAIAALRTDAGTATAQVDKEIAEINEEIAACDRAKAAEEERARAKTRIAELEEQERVLAAEAEKITRELFLADEFIRRKVSLLTDRINSRFKLARFKLFDVQVNEAINECCETTFEGVPFGSLNHGSRVNVGLDICETLGQHYGFTPCIWIDNSESVTRLLPTTAQQIRLVVSAADKSLRIETTSHKEATTAA